MIRKLHILHPNNSICNIEFVDVEVDCLVYVRHAKDAFSHLWKTGTDLSLVTSGGSEYQVRGAATLKARDATTNFVRGMMRSFFFGRGKVLNGTFKTYCVSGSQRCSSSRECHILYMSRDTL